MSKITVRDVHVDVPLSNFSIGYHPHGMVAEMIAPPLKVNKESDKYYVWDRQSAFNTHNAAGDFSLRPDKAESKRIDFGLSTATYQAEEYALNILVSDREKSNADSVLRLRESKVRRLKDLMMLEQELRVGTLLTTAGNWDAAHTAAVGVKWDAASGVVIEEDLDDAKEVVRKAVGQDPNIVVIPAAISKIAKRDSSIRELIKYTQNDLLVNGDLPPTMFNMKVIIPGAVYTASKEGASTVTYTDVWGDNVLLLAVPPETTIDSHHPVKIFRSRDWRVKSWREERRDSEAIEVSVVQDEVITSNISGYLYTDVTSA